ncbi:CLUMA_CG009660, isoform A [Clunio marinus]|uniref:CLUMA_CG009660, isoform A n=1 Tax=Clunio marinus TaxID=568069 RepID=A0A1J1ICR7_9DIPT|nr:CLUMA_CG009660, isoform A [Clunio marinus]
MRSVLCLYLMLNEGKKCVKWGQYLNEVRKNAHGNQSRLWLSHHPNMSKKYMFHNKPENFMSFSHAIYLSMDNDYKSNNKTKQKQPKRKKEETANLALVGLLVVGCYVNLHFIRIISGEISKQQTMFKSKQCEY